MSIYLKLCWIDNMSELFPVSGKRVQRKCRKNSWVHVSAAMAAVHFSPDLLSEKRVTSQMINACVRWAVSELQQPLKPDSQGSLSPTTPRVQPPSVLRRHKSMEVSARSGQNFARSCLHKNIIGFISICVGGPSTLSSVLTLKWINWLWCGNKPEWQIII